MKEFEEMGITDILGALVGLAITGVVTTPPTVDEFL